MEIKLSQSEIVAIIKKHLEKQNISSGDIILQVAGSQIQAMVLDAQGKVQEGPTKPHTNPPFGQRIFPNGPGVNDSNKQVQTDSVFTDDLAETLGQVFSSFNKTVDDLSKKVDSVKSIKKHFDPTDMDKNPFKPRDTM